MIHCRVLFASSPRGEKHLDWFVPNDTAAASELRSEFADYLERHAAPGSDLLGATLVFSELLTNALESSEQPVWVSLDWGGDELVLSVHDLGSGFEPPTEPSMPDADSKRGRGLMIVTHLTEHLDIAAKRAGGSRVTATLPIRRPPSESYDPKPLPSHQLLPSPGETNESGRYGRESFLRALTVQLARSAETASGPAIAEKMVAEVGGGVGIRMEEAFRLARQRAEGALSVEELGDLFVDLKDGIGGDFFVIEADENRIVLGNRRCPFGEAVQRAPSLCRMTSSVFGGIAARNRGVAAVHLEERIALGDPECRVTVWLSPPPDEIQSVVHFYGRERPAHA